MIGLMTALVLFAQGAPDATATTTTTTTTPATTPSTAEISKVSSKAKPDPDALICHDEATLGSRFTHKVCQSRRGAAMRAQDDRESIRHVQDMTPAPTLH